MGVNVNGPGDVANLTPEPSQVNVRHRDLLKRAEVQFRSSATVLRASGVSEHAWRAEQFAEWTGLQLDAPEAAQALYTILTDSARGSSPTVLMSAALDCVLDLLHTDRGNIQLADPASGELNIAAQRGFDAEFCEYFATVADSSSACGRAAEQRAQVMIADVSDDPGFESHRDIAAASGFRAVQSTPLTAFDGRLVGMLSTHYARPLRLPDRDLLILRRIGILLGERLRRLQRLPPLAG